MLVVTLLTVVLISAATNATSPDDHRCSPDQPSTGSSASGIDDLQQVTTLQYCLVDDCTIMVIDTGEELDIVYTTNSLLIVTVKGNQTSLVVVKSENEQSCVQTDGEGVIVIIQEVLHALIALMNAYILVLHLMFKDMRTLLGQLLIIYCTSLLALYTSSKVMYLAPFTTNSLFMCQILTLIYLLSVIAREACATCILACVDQIMHRSDNLRSGMPKHQIRKYFMYIFGTLALFSVVVVGYHFITGNPVGPRSGPCQQVDSFVLILIAFSYVTLNKAIQIGLFTVYLFYLFKFSKERVIRNSDVRIKLSKIAIILGATTGLAQVVWLAALLAGISSAYGNVLGLVPYLVQHCVIAAVMTCSKHMANRCRKKFHSR